MSKTTKIDMLTLNFIGEHVDVLSEFNSIETKQGVLPITFSGYLIDHDSDFLYIGNKDRNIEKAVNKSKIVYIEVSEPTDHLKQILEGVDISDQLEN